MTWLAFFGGVILGGGVAFTLCIRWAWRALKPIMDFVEQHGGWDKCEAVLKQMIDDAESYRALRKARLAK